MNPWEWDWGCFSFRESDVPVCLVGNKQDLCHVRQVRQDEGRRLAQENRCHFQEVSAAESYQDISILFTQLIRQVMEQLKHRADKRRYSGSKSMAKLINNVFGKRRKSVWGAAGTWRLEPVSKGNWSRSDVLVRKHIQSVLENSHQQRKGADDIIWRQIIVIVTLVVNCTQSSVLAVRYSCFCLLLLF